MKTTWLMLCVGLVCDLAMGLPYQGYRLLPRRAVMFGGYYSNPLFGRSFDVAPRGAMSAVVTRDAVATNTYSGDVPPYPPLDALPVQENETVEQFTERAVELLPPQYGPPEVPAAGESPTPTHPEAGAPPEEILRPSEAALVDDLAEEVSTEAVTKASKRVAKKKKVARPTAPPAADEEEEEEEEEGLPATWPFGGGKGAVPSYNAFFPITISGGAPSRRRSSQQGQGQGDLEDYFPGSATAIANSFSTGKGGIATSHATSFGDPYLASLVRNGLLNFRSKKPQES